ncbi:MAG: hypothetical protein GY759_17775, partial [Chloroflexi bacterium]|nr:hypothetical protein [Chloroflexota bacterium]
MKVLMKAAAMLAGLLLVIGIWNSGSETLSTTAKSDAPAVFDCRSAADVPPEECWALMTLYETTNGPGWQNRTNWGSFSDVCNWYGVICATIDGGKHVSELHLLNNYLVGTLPATLSGLTYLSGFDFRINSLSGPIPPELGGLIHLTGIALDNNQLSGVIPSDLADLTQLRDLSISGNKLTGDKKNRKGEIYQLRSLW